MINRSPQFMDDLIMSDARRKTGLAVNDITPLTSAHATQQARDRFAVEDAGKRLALGESALKENARQFNKMRGFEKDIMNQNQRQANIATALNVGNLGLGIGNRYLQNKQNQQYDAFWNDIMGQLGKLKQQQKQGSQDVVGYYNDRGF